MYVSCFFCPLCFHGLLHTYVYTYIHDTYISSHSISEPHVSSLYYTVNTYMHTYYGMYTTNLSPVQTIRLFQSVIQDSGYIIYKFIWLRLGGQITIIYETSPSSSRAILKISSSWYFLSESEPEGVSKLNSKTSLISSWDDSDSRVLDVSKEEIWICMWDYRWRGLVFCLYTLTETRSSGRLWSLSGLGSGLGSGSWAGTKFFHLKPEVDVQKTEH